MIGEFWPQSGLVGLWHLNGNSNDSSGNAYNGVDTNITYSLANGKFGQGAGFNGTSSKIVANAPDYYGSQNLSFSAWIYLTSLPPSGKKMVPFTVFESATPTTYDKAIRINNNGSVETYVYDGVEKIAVSPAGSISIYNWYHVFGVFDGSYIYLYLNGDFVTKVVASGSYNFTTPKIGIGHYDGGASNSYYAGGIDEIALFSRALSASDIRKWYAWARGRYI